MLLAYIQHQLLPIFESANRYTFAIVFHSASNTASNTIAFLLKIPQIIRCSTLEIQIYGVYQLFEVPVETISNWLNRPPNDDERDIERRHLESVNCPFRDRALRNCHLKEVRFFLKILFHKNNVTGKFVDRKCINTRMPLTVGEIFKQELSQSIERPKKIAKFKENKKTLL